MSKKHTRKLKLGGHTVLLKWKSLKDFEDAEDMSIAGYYDFKNKTIYMNQDQTGSDAQDTLIHEMLHCIDDTFQLALKHKDIHIIATGLQQLLKPWLKKV